MSQAREDFTGPGPDAVYEQALKNGEFRIQQCGHCGKHVFYPRAICHHCGSSALRWVAASGRGTVYSTSVVRQRPEDGPDYNIALIDLEEGPRMMTRVVDVAPTDVRIGMPVQGSVGQIDGAPAVVFRPVAGGAGR